MKPTPNHRVLTPGRSTRPSRWHLKQLLCWSAVLLLAGCASEMGRREGMSLIMEGHYEEGLAKLEQATREDPKNILVRKEYLRQREQVINRVLNAAGSELANERYEGAEGLYRRALNLEPANQAARDGLAEVVTARRHARWLADAQAMFKKGDSTGAKATINLILLERPGDVKANQLRYQLEEQALKENMAGPRLNIKGRRPVTLQFRDANLKMVLEALARTTGVNIMIDKDVRNDIKVSIFVKDTAVEETLDLILMQNQLEKRILGENSVLIYPQTPAKSKEYQELKVRRFALVNADAKQVQSMIKTILKTKDIYVDERSNAVVIRDTASVIRLAEKLVSSMDQPDSEVMLEVELLDVDRNRSLDLGIDWPTSASATLSWPLSGAAATLQAFKNMTNADVGMSVSSATVKAKANAGNSDTRTLATPRIRVRNKEKAKIMIGDRTPVISSAAVPGSTVSGTAAVFNTNIQYLETGIKLEVEPTIYPDGNVAIRLNLEVSKLGDQVTTNSGTVAFKTTTNNASTVLRLKDGETQVMGGLIQSSDSMAQNNKVPGLGDIPFLGRLFGIQSDQWGNRELVLAITPHIIRNNQISEADLLELWSGTESSVKYTAPDLKVAASTGVVSQGAGAAAVAGRLPAPPAPRAAPAIAAAQTLSVNVSGPAQARIGDKINVALNAQGGVPINTLSLTLAYDSEALKPLTVSEGDLLRRGGVKGSFDWKIDAASGTVSADLATESGSTANAVGGIANLQFEVIGGQGPVLINASGISATGASGAIPVANPPALSIAIQP